MRYRGLPLLVLCALLAVGLTLAPPGATSAAPATPAYELAGQCVQVGADSGDVPAGRYRLKAAALGQFLFFRSDERLLTARSGKLQTAATPTRATIWSVDRVGNRYRLTAVDAPRTQRTVTLTPAQGCRDFPEAALNVDGPLPTDTPQTGALRGLVEGHAHLMSEQFLGGGLHCGEPFSPLGITVALQDCPDHGSDGWPALSEHILSQPGPHDVGGWPSFEGWPQWYSLTHEQTYYRWIERAWRGGLRLINNYYVQNRVLCELYPLGDEPCNEMESVRIQHRRLQSLQDYIDAQAGGPGKGFLRIVTDPAQLRAVIAAGKLAVTLGIEISEPFGCRQLHGRPQCSRTDIDRGMDELHRLGIRQLILTHKFDNALGGAHIDDGVLGVAVQTGQVISTGRGWSTEPCRTEHRDNVAPGDRPGRCNNRGLTSLGAHAVRAAIDRRMVVDIDHLSVKAADKVLQLAADAGYPGVTSSHDWTDPDNYQRILALGGAVGLYANGAEDAPDQKHDVSFVTRWRDLRRAAGDRPLGLAFGTDMGGLGKQAPPRPDAAKRPVRYPFLAADGRTTIHRQVTGERVFDVNVDGNAHFGLVPDWVESLRLTAGADGAALVADLYRAAEAFTGMWERVEAHR